jgi:hypothetical protein
MIVALTDEQAQRLLTTRQQRFLALIRHKPVELKPPVDSMEGLWDEIEKQVVDARLARAIVGSPDIVARKLAEFLEITGVQEIFAVTDTYEQADRLLSYELLGEVVRKMPLKTATPTFIRFPGRTWAANASGCRTDCCVPFGHTCSSCIRGRQSSSSCRNKALETSSSMLVVTDCHVPRQFALPAPLHAIYPTFHIKGCFTQSLSRRLEDRGSFLTNHALAAIGWEKSHHELQPAAKPLCRKVFEADVHRHVMPHAMDVLRHCARKRHTHVVLKAPHAPRRYPTRQQLSLGSQSVLVDFAADASLNSAPRS